MASGLFDQTIVGTAERALEVTGNILEAPTDYSIIGESVRANPRPNGSPRPPETGLTSL